MFAIEGIHCILYLINLKSTFTFTGGVLHVLRTVRRGLVRHTL